MDYLVVYNSNPVEIDDIKLRNQTLKILFNVFQCEDDDVYFECFDEDKIYNLIKGFYVNKLLVFEVTAINFSNYDDFEGLKITSKSKVHYSSIGLAQFSIEININDDSKTCFYNLYLNNKISYQELDTKNTNARVSKVMRSIPNLGFVKAHELGQLCLNCSYYDNNGLIHCAVRPSSKLNEVYQCNDFELVSNQ